MATAEKPSGDATKPPTQETKEEIEGALEFDRISLGGWFRSMLAIAACVFRHPFSTTYVDLSTGEAVQGTE